ncbi:MAG: YezD family protein [Holophagales bacterium]|nr:MAG: YezD family protein [Holophagales bacterium]
MTAPALPPTAAARELVAALAPQLARALAELRFGAVELVVHDGRVVQIERRERLRLTADPEPGEASRIVPSAPDRPRPDRRSLRRETSTGDSA